MELDLKKMGERIREIREEKGLTQRELGNKAGISHGYISDLERGKPSPSIEKVAAIAESLGTDISSLVGEEAGSGMIQELKKAGISRVFHSTGTGEAKEEIRVALQKAKEDQQVLLGGIGLIQFFRIPSFGGTWNPQVKKLIERGSKLRVILLDPRSDAALERAKLDQKYQYPLLEEGIFKTMGNIMSLAEKYSNVKLGLLNFHPLGRIVLTEEVAFYKPYHLGERDDPREGREKAVSGMPIMIKSEKGRKFYNLTRLQFENLWKQTEKVSTKKQAEAIQDGVVETWERVNKGVKELYHQIKDSGYEPDVIIGIDRSGAIVGGALALNLMDIWKAEFQVLKRDYKKKRHGIRPVEVYDTLTTDLHDKKVLLVDSELREVRSIEKAINIIRKKGPKELQTACLYVTGEPRQTHLSKVDFHVYEIDEVRTMPWIYNEDYLDIY